MSKATLDLYSDYLLSSFGAATATGLSNVLSGVVSHDQITRWLAGSEKTSADLWQSVKPLVREMQSSQGVVVVDDSIVEKPHSDESELICWHYDHSQGRNVKGINFLTALYCSQEVNLPVAYALVRKSEVVCDAQSGRRKRRSPVTKNEHYRALLEACVRNRIPFAYVLNDNWYASAENMRFVHQTLSRDFVMALKANRKIALSAQEKAAGCYQMLNLLYVPEGTVWEVYLESVDFPLLLAQQHFTNEDGSTGILYLVTSDLTLTWSALTTIYQTRWRIEAYHRSLKQNAAVDKSPAHTLTTQSNHFFAALCAFCKLEWLRTHTALNHYALKTRIYCAARLAAFHALQALQPYRFEPAPTALAA